MVKAPETHSETTTSVRFVSLKRDHTTTCVTVNVDGESPRDTLGDRNDRTFRVTQKLAVRDWETVSRSEVGTGVTRSLLLLVVDTTLSVGLLVHIRLDPGRTIENPEKLGRQR